MQRLISLLTACGLVLTSHALSVSSYFAHHTPPEDSSATAATAVYERDTLVISDAGWRARCKISDVPFVLSLVIESHDVFTYLSQNHRYAELEDGTQVDVGDVFTVNTPLVAKNDVTLFLPVNEVLRGKTKLCKPEGDVFAAIGRQKARFKKIKGEAHLMLRITEAGEFATALVTPTHHAVSFEAPKGMTVVSVEMRASQPATFARAKVNETASQGTFAALMNSDDLSFKFVMTDEDGHLAETEWIHIDLLLRKYTRRVVVPDRGPELVRLNRKLPLTTLVAEAR